MFQLFHPMRTSMELIKKICDAKSGVLPKEFRSEFPQVAEIIVRCLERDPNDRPSLEDIRVAVTPQPHSPLLGSCGNMSTMGSSRTLSRKQS